MRLLVGGLAVLACLAWPVLAAAQPTNLATYTLFGSRVVRIGAAATVTGGAVGSNETVIVRGGSVIAPIATDRLRLGGDATVQASGFFNTRDGTGTIVGASFTPVPLPILTLPAPPVVSPSSANVDVPAGATQTIAAGAYGSITIHQGAVVSLSGSIDADSFVARSGAAPAQVSCAVPSGCTVRVQSRLVLDANFLSSTPLAFAFAGTKTVAVGGRERVVHASIFAPSAKVKLRSTSSKPARYVGTYAADRVLVGAGAVVDSTVTGAVCGDLAISAGEGCDPPQDSACPSLCQSNCACPPPPLFALHSIGPSVLNNATNFGVQVFGVGFQFGAQLELSDKASDAVIEVLPTNFVSASELTALVPAGMAVPSGIQRELVARVINPGNVRSDPPDIGHCQTDTATSPIACHSGAPCPPDAGDCVTGTQRLTMFNDLVFLNPNSAVVVPDPYGVCDDGAPCQGASDCAGIGAGACSPKVYVTPQQVDELWVYNTGAKQFVDKNAATPGIQGIPVGDNPFHVELLIAGGSPRAWVVNRFDDAISIVDPATDSELNRVAGAALGIPGRLRMGTEIEFNRAGTRAYLSNQNLDEVLVFDIAGGNRDAPVFVGSIDVGVNPRGMATNTADTRLYVANIQSADISVVDITPGSPTENEVLDTIGARATDDIVGGRADGWEPFIIGGRAPRGIIFSDDLQALFVTSIGPQTGPRPGVGQNGGAIINPTITVIDAASDAIVAHVALNGTDPANFKCTDPELMALDDVRGRLYVTCQGSGIVDILDTAALVAAAAAELRMVFLPLPMDATVPTLSLPSQIGPPGGRVCGAMTGNPGTGCLTDAACFACPTLIEGIPAQCCVLNNPISLHHGPRGIALSPDRNTLYVVNQFTTSISTIDVNRADPGSIFAAPAVSFPGAFGSDTEQRDRRLGQIEFFSDVKGTNTSCATCHIDDHQDGVFFEADVAGPRLRRVLSVRGTRDFPPLLQDQLLPDLVAFTDLVVHAERLGPVGCTPCVELAGVFTCFTNACSMTSNSENQQNTLYAKAITFFPNPNLEPDGSFSAAVPLPGGVTGNAVSGEQLFDQLACASCHPEPMFTLDQFRVFAPQGFGVQPVRMRDVQTPVHLPLRSMCQDANRPAGVDGSNGFGTPTLRGIWDTFPLLMSGSAGLEVIGSDPVFASCTPGSNGCCTQLLSPITPAGNPVPEQHLEVGSKDALRAALSPPLAVPGTGHGAALMLNAQQLNDLIAYLRSL